MKENIRRLVGVREEVLGKRNIQVLEQTSPNSSGLNEVDVQFSLLQQCRRKSRAHQEAYRFRGLWHVALPFPWGIALLCMVHGGSPPGLQSKQ